MRNILCQTVAVTLLGCSTVLAEDDIAALKKRNLELEKKVAALEAQLQKTTKAEPAAGTDGGKAVATPTEPEEVPIMTPWLGRVRLRKSVFDEKSIPDPAQFTYVRPGSGQETWSVDAGVGIDLVPLQNAFSQTEIFLGLDYHRNTDPKTLTELFQTGLIAKTFLLEPGDAMGMNIDWRVGFKNDNVKDIQAVSAAADIYPRWNWLLTDNLHPLGFSMWRWEPFAGVFYDDITDTAANAEKGHRTVGRYGAQLQFYPLWSVKSPLTGKNIETSVEMAATYTNWRTMGASGIYNADKASSFFESRITYTFNAKEPRAVFAPSGGGSPALLTTLPMEMGVTLKYENGDNPELGIADVDQFTLSLSARF